MSKKMCGPNRQSESGTVVRRDGDDENNDDRTNDHSPGAPGVGKNGKEVEGPRAETTQPVLGRQPSSDFPTPKALGSDVTFMWDDDELQAANYTKLGQCLNTVGDLYRAPAYAGGLLLASASPNIPPKEVVKSTQLAALIANRLRVRVIKNGKPAGTQISGAHLTTMLAAEMFLQQFPALDAVVNVPQYLGDFRLTMPGYNDGGPGERIFYVGPVPEVSASMDTINRFLDVMAFEGEADRTNAVAAALTVMLRNLWPGGKPMVLVTSTKSHGGKDTIIDFACGRTPHTSVSYEYQDWALQKNFAAMIKHNPDLGVVNVENVRIDGGRTFVRSAFLERLLTDPRPVFFTTGTGDPTPRKNDIVVAMSTNNAAHFRGPVEPRSAGRTESCGRCCQPYVAHRKSAT